jgi:hypothetical protein
MSVGTQPATDCVVRPDELNADCVNTLRNLGVADGEYVAVVGAGPSSPLIPTGDTMAVEMAKRCGIAPPSPHTPFWEFYEAAKTNKKEEYSEFIKSKFNKHEYWRSDTYELICKISFKSIITTNYDAYLPSAFEKVEGTGWDERFCIYPPRKTEKSGLATAIDFEDQKYLIAIHGYRDSLRLEWPLDSIILAKSDYQLHYFDPEKAYYLHSWWKEILARFDCIFIGTSLLEPGIGDVLQELADGGIIKRKSRRHIHLLDVYPAANSVTGVQQPPAYPKAKILHNCVQQVLYDPKQSYLGLLEVLSKISANPVCTVFEPKMKAPKFPDFSNESLFFDAP